MGNCLSSSSKNHHVRVKGVLHDDDDELGGGGTMIPLKKLTIVKKGGDRRGNHHQNGSEKHLDNTETSLLDGTDVDTTIPLSPDPATLDTSTTITTTTTTTPTGATTAVTTPKMNISNGNGGGGHVIDIDDDDGAGGGVEAALMTTLIAPHKRTDDSPGTEQPAVIFSLSEDVSSVRSNNSTTNSHHSSRRNNTSAAGGQGQQQQQHVVVPSKAFSLATGHHHQQQQQQQHHHTRQGRALQARLQKARYMQMAMMNKTSPSSTRSLNSETGSFSSIPEDDDDYQVSNAGLPLRYSMSTGSEMSTPNNNSHKRHRSGGSAGAASAGLNEEFEANMNKGMIWAEVERDHAVLAVALSRQKPTLLRSTPPPLFLAVGTETGTVTVTELLDDSSSPLLTRASSLSAARLGSTVSITRPRGGRIRSLDFSPNGSFLAVAGDDCICAICRLDFAEEFQLTHLQVVAEIPRVDRIYAVQFSPNNNGAFLAIGGFDGNVAIVSMMNNMEQQQQQSRAATARGGRGGGGGPTAAAAALESVVVREIPCDSLVLTLDFSPDGQYLAIGMTNKTCVLVDVTDSWQVVYTIRRPASVQTVQWHPNGGRYLAIGSNDVVIIDRETFAIKHELDVRGGGREEATRNGMSSSPASPNGRQQQQQQQQQQRSVFRVNTVCWSPNGSFLVTNGSDNRCKLLETKTYTTIHEIRRTGITSVVWGQQNVIAGIPHRYLAMGGDDKKVVILKAGLEISNGNSSVGDDISSAASSYFSNRGDWVLKENAFRDVEENAPHVTLYAGGGGGRTLHSTGSSGGPVGSLIHAVAFSRGSKSRPSAFFAVATGDGQVTIRSTLGWKIISQTRFLNPTLCMAFSNGSRLLALGGEDGKLRLVATAPLWSVIAEVSFDARINSLAFSKNNERIAVGSGDGILSFVCPQDNFRVVGEITENGSDILCIDWSSKNLAVGREDGVVHIHDSDSIFHGRQKPSAVLECRKAVRSVAFGASSRFLVTGGDAGVIGVYSARGGWVMVHQISAGFGISTLKWSPSGRHLVYIGDESNQFQVVDTIFWAEVGEASAALWVPTTKTPGQGGSFAAGLSFSQDGKMVAFSSSQSGTRIINTVSWDVVLTLAQPAAPSPVVSEESSSISSPDEGQGHLGSASE